MTGAAVPSNGAGLPVCSRRRPRTAGRGRGPSSPRAGSRGRSRRPCRTGPSPGSRPAAASPPCRRRARVAHVLAAAAVAGAREGGGAIARPARLLGVEERRGRSDGPSRRRGRSRASSSRTATPEAPSLAPTKPGMSLVSWWAPTTTAPGSRPGMRATTLRMGRWTRTSRTPASRSRRRSTAPPGGSPPSPPAGGRAATWARRSRNARGRRTCPAGRASTRRRHLRRSRRAGGGGHGCTSAHGRGPLMTNRPSFPMARPWLAARVVAWPNSTWIGSARWTSRSSPTKAPRATCTSAGS